MKTRIHVNQHNIKANNRLLKSETLKPVITVKDYKQNRKGQTARVMDANGNEVARVVYRPNEPLPCGAHCWIETELNVLVE